LHLAWQVAVHVWLPPKGHFATQRSKQPGFAATGLGEYNGSALTLPPHANNMTKAQTILMPRLHAFDMEHNET